MAAAAALSRSRGAGARTTAGLFFILTLLSLLCLANSHLNKNDLEKLKGKIRKLEKQLDFQKAIYESLPEMMHAYVDIFYPLSDYITKDTSGLPDGFPPLGGLMHEVKDFFQKSMVFADKKIEEMIDKIESKEDQVREMKKVIQVLEEQEAEL